MHDGAPTDGIGAFAPFTLSGPTSAPPTSAKPLTRYLKVDTGATDRRTDIFIPPEDAKELGLGDPVRRSGGLRGVAGTRVLCDDYPVLV